MKVNERRKARSSLWGFRKLDFTLSLALPRLGGTARRLPCLGLLWLPNRYLRERQPFSETSNEVHRRAKLLPHPEERRISSFIGNCFNEAAGWQFEDAPTGNHMFSAGGVGRLQQQHRLHLYASPCTPIQRTFRDNFPSPSESASAHTFASVSCGTPDFRIRTTARLPLRYPSSVSSFSNIFANLLCSSPGLPARCMLSVTAIVLQRTQPSYSSCLLHVFGT